MVVTDPSTNGGATDDLIYFKIPFRRTKLFYFKKETVQSHGFKLKLIYFLIG